jgi:hypothetical protein
MPAEDPLAIKVRCKNCGLVQTYKGQIPCDRCKESGSLQLLTKPVQPGGKNATRNLKA